MSIVRHLALTLQPVTKHFTLRHEALQTVLQTFIALHENLGYPVSQTFILRHEVAAISAATAYKPSHATGRVKSLFDPAGATGGPG